MQKQPDKIDRKMVPRWRGLAFTPAAELRSANKRPGPHTPIVGAVEAREEWAAARTPWAAAEVVAASTFLGKDAVADEAVAYLSCMLGDLAPGLRQMVISYSDDKVVAENDGGIPTDKYVRFRAISELKSLIDVYPKNPIPYVEIARLQVSLGQRKAAERSFRIALGLAPNNRYILRSAVRFFVHQGDFAAAWQVIRDSAPNDPWLLASKIAVADLANKPQPNSRQILSVLDHAAPAQTTELAASLATLELQSGNFKRSRRLFSQSSEAPTENAVAQIRWANEITGTPFDLSLLETSRSFEARTGDALNKKDWSGAATSSEDWLTDEPFSSRAAATACYLFAELLQDFSRSEQIATFGLLATPHDPLLLNNRAFARANLGNVHQARTDLIEARAHSPSRLTEICLEATEGCILYREGRPEQAALMYRSAIEGAVREKNSDAAQRAYIHWLHEESRYQNRPDQETTQLTFDFFENDKRVSDSIKQLFRLLVVPHISKSAEGVSVTDASDLAKALIGIEV